MLSEEEKKAIENLKDFKSISILYGNTFTMFLEQLKKYQEATDTILNLINKLQKEAMKDGKNSEVKITTTPTGTTTEVKQKPRMQPDYDIEYDETDM